MAETSSLIFLSVVSAGLCWIDLININNQIKKIAFIGMLLWALYVGCIMFPYSDDYEIYQMYYKYASGTLEFSFDNTIFDYGYVWLCTIVKSFGGELDTVYFVTCGLTLILYYFSIIKYTKYTFVAWFFIIARYFLVQNIIQIRQGLACAIMLFSLRFIQQKNVKMFIICMIPAILIHKTLLLALLLYPLSRVRWNKVKIILVFLTSILFLFIPFVDIIFNSLLPMTGFYIPKLVSYMGTKYMVTLGVGDVLFRFIFIGFFSVVLLKMISKPYSNILLSMLLMALLVLCMFKDFSVLGGRLASIGFLAFTFTPAYIFELFPRHKIAIMTIVISVGCVFCVKNIVMI